MQPRLSTRDGRRVEPDHVLRSQISASCAERCSFCFRDSPAFIRPKEVEQRRKPHKHSFTASLWCAKQQFCTAPERVCVDRGFDISLSPLSCQILCQTENILQPDPFVYKRNERKRYRSSRCNDYRLAAFCAFFCSFRARSCVVRS